MKRAYWKDILSTIMKSKKRFLSILMITALGVTVLTGIYAACEDLYHSADRFYDQQNLFDIQIISTLGLTDDDVDALQQIDGIAEVTGAYSETVQTNVDGVDTDADVTVLNSSSINEPYLQEGSLPAHTGEIAVTREYLDDTGKSIGDEITIVEDIDHSDAGDSADIEDNSETTADNSEAADNSETADNTETADSSDTGENDTNWDIDAEVEEEEETPTFTETTFTITGVVLNPESISNSSATFRTSNSSEYTFYISAEDADFDIYTTIYLTLTGLDELNCFSDEYDAAVQDVIDFIETQIKDQREEARYDAVYTEALEQVTDAEDTMNKSFADADQEITDACDEIEKSKQELLDGEAELTKEEEDAKQEIADARTELENGKQQLRDAEVELASGEAELEANRTSLEEAQNQLTNQKTQAEAEFASTETVFAKKQSELDASLTELTSGVDQLKQQFGEDWPKKKWNALVSAASASTVKQLGDDSESEPDSNKISKATSNEQNSLSEALGEIIASWENPEIDAAALIANCVQSGLSLGIVNGSQQVLDSQKSAYETQKAAALQQIADAESKVAAGNAQIESAKQQIASGKAEITSGWSEMNTGEAELNSSEETALQEIADAWSELEEGKQELSDAEAELIESEQEYQDKKEEAKQKIADAYEKLEDIDTTVWYVQDRTALGSYSDLQSDMSSIETIGNVFPIVFLVVAVLISLTTMTRMVEEERGLIGTYKALGFGDLAIYLKYLIYAFLACLLGGILGDVFGFIVLPKILITILQSLYSIPNIYLSFDLLYGVGGVLLFLVSVVVSTAIACRYELSQTPAALMRPKAPRAGSRIALEYVPLIWKNLRFLNKVTARNLFRYKKRMFMTVLGITGCTALVLCGFAIRDSVLDLTPKQYDQTYLYDLMVVTDDNEEFLDYIADDTSIFEYLNLQIESIKLTSSDGDSESVTMIVIPTGASIKNYISIRDTEGAAINELSSEGVYVTQNAAELLSLKAGGTVTMQNLQLESHDTIVTEVVQNYLGNNVYMTQELYESLFGEYEPNGILANLSLDAKDQGNYAQSLLENDFVVSSVSIEASRADFASNFTLLNAVVYLLIVLAAGLAFAVLFTLSNTNISERNRELATIKVLGFFDREVHSYVNKETIILTIIGILIGLPVGRFISGLLTAALKMPSLYFAVYVAPSSYLISAVISLCFALIVDLMTNRTLDHIDMVEALKSVE